MKVVGKDIHAKATSNTNSIFADVTGADDAKSFAT